MGNISVDFTGVETRENLPAGEYAVEVTKIEERQGNKGPYLNWEFRVCVGPFSGKKIWNITSLSPKSLWVLRKQLDALGMRTTSSKTTLNLDALVGSKCGVKVEPKEFDGKTKAKIIDFFPLEELSPVEQTSSSDDDEEF